MVLSHDELQALIQVRHRSPHTLLGMHPLGDGSGVVVRAFIPDAASIEVQPVHERNKPRFKLQRVHEAGVFEGISKEAQHVYAYDLVVTDGAGKPWRMRDAYSFLPTLGEQDLYLFGKGDERKLYDKLGAQMQTIDGVAGTSFAVWAPNAQRVSVIGDFNGWDGRRHAMRSLGSSGVWEIFIPGVGEGALYKFEIRDVHGNVVVKTDPFGFLFELPPKQAAVVWNNKKHTWRDGVWMTKRRKVDPLRRPMSIYEVHLGSWMKKTAFESYNYRELAPRLVDYVRKMGFTHVEFLPVAEHAYYPSWGYQVTGFFAPTSRFGTPDEFQFLVDALHDADIGVIVDWVPAHFPRDEWALAKFDGTALFEHEDPRKGAHQDWGTLIFNFGRHEVSNFLVANALFWCDRFHIDGLRVDAVASMLYLDYSRKEGEWIPNQFGGRIAEESTAWPQVTRPPYLGGLGFSFKWNMGWMHDTLGYFKREPVHRKYHQNDLTFAMVYHYHENFILPLSHDEVVHGKGSLRGRMPGDDWQGFANLRALLGYQWMFPGKKLLFMGGELGQRAEWNENTQLDWWLLNEGPFHKGAQKFLADLNALYQREPALWETDYDYEGFFWIDCSNSEQSVLSFVRRSRDGKSTIAVILNLTPVPRTNYRIGLPIGGHWKEVLNSDAGDYGGSNTGNLGGVTADDYKVHGQPFSAPMTLPPLSVIAFKATV
jgi:1,4-alpha-glucan branching enzyme